MNAYFLAARAPRPSHIVERKWFSPWHSTSSRLLLSVISLDSLFRWLECVSAIAMFVFSFPVDMAPVSGLGWYTIGISYKSSSFSLPHSWRFPFHLMGIQCGCLLIWINTSIIIIFIHFIWLTSTSPLEEGRGPYQTVVLLNWLSVPNRCRVHFLSAHIIAPVYRRRVEEQQ